MRKFDYYVLAWVAGLVTACFVAIAAILFESHHRGGWAHIDQIPEYLARAWDCIWERPKK